MRKAIMIAALLPLVSGGCVAKAAWEVATLPVKVASAGVDKLTTSQDEADRNYGRKLRKEEEARGRAERKAEKEARRDRERDD
ncbi:MAG: hypothetical protein V4659_09590 [Pseudomonadota bacterium]